MLPAGVILVFCIVFLVVCGIVALSIRNRLLARKKASVDY